MYARAVDDAAERLGTLKRDECFDFVLGGAAVAVALAVFVTRIHPELGLPLFVGGLGVGMLGFRAIFQRWDLIEGLAEERDAYAIPEVVAYATREATMERRQTFAALLRRELQPYCGGGTRVVAVSDELEGLARDLEDPTASLAPIAAVRCMRMLYDPIASPLFNPALPPDELRSCIRRIRAGFERKPSRDVAAI